MRLTKKDKIKELLTFEKHKVLMTDSDYKELKLGQLEDILEKYEIDSFEELSKILDDYDDTMEYVIAVGAFLFEKGLGKEFKEFVREGAKKK